MAMYRRCPVPACARREIVLEGEVGVYLPRLDAVRAGGHSCVGYDTSPAAILNIVGSGFTSICPDCASYLPSDASFHVEMQNHLHLLLRTRPDLVSLWGDEEVARRWLTISRLIHSRD